MQKDSSSGLPPQSPLPKVRDDAVISLFGGVNRDLFTKLCFPSVGFTKRDLVAAITVATQWWGQKGRTQNTGAAASG